MFCWLKPVSGLFKVKAGEKSLPGVLILWKQPQQRNSPTALSFWRAWQPPLQGSEGCAVRPAPFSPSSVMMSPHRSLRSGAS